MIAAIKEFYRFYGYWAQFYTLVALNVADFFITRHAVLTRGAEAEYNPLVRTIISHHGMTSVLWSKLLVLGVMFLLLKTADFAYGGGSATEKMKRTKLGKILMIANGFYAVVVLWSLLVVGFNL